MNVTVGDFILSSDIYIEVSDVWQSA